MRPAPLLALDLALPLDLDLVALLPLDLDLDFELERGELDFAEPARDLFDEPRARAFGGRVLA